MALAMSRPWKHPKTGIYWLRRRVPKELVALVGQREVKKTLGTRVPAEAKLKLVQALAELDTQWAGLRLGPRQITESEAHSLAVAVHDAWLAEHRDNPSYQEFWLINLHARLWTGDFSGSKVQFREGTVDGGWEEFSDKRWAAKMLAHCYDVGDEILSKHGFSRDTSSRWKAAKAVSEALQRASITLDREARGIYEYGGEPVAASVPMRPPPSIHGVDSRSETGLPAQGKAPKGCSFDELVGAWWREAQAGGRKPSTYESYSNTLSNFERFLGHNDAARVTAEDVIRFKDFRLTTPSTRTGRVASAKTVKGTDLTALKTVFGWAVTNRRLPKNPAADVGVKVGKSPACARRASPKQRHEPSFGRPSRTGPTGKFRKRQRARNGFRGSAR